MVLVGGDWLGTYFRGEVHNILTKRGGGGEE